MEIKTKALGTVTIEDDQIITLSEGFYGFKKYHRFALIDAKQKPFIWIQSLDDAQLAFIAIDPFIFRPDYELDIDDRSVLTLRQTYWYSHWLPFRWMARQLQQICKARSSSIKRISKRCSSSSVGKNGKPSMISSPK